MNMSTLKTDKKLFRTTLSVCGAFLILLSSGCESMGNLLPEAPNGGKVTVVKNDVATLCSSENNSLVVGNIYEVYRRETVRNQWSHAAQKTRFKDTAIAKVRIESIDAKCVTAAIVSGSVLANDFVKLE
jgi:hypothetical protein